MRPFRQGLLCIATVILVAAPLAMMEVTQTASAASPPTVKCTDLLGQGTPDDIYATVKVTGCSPTITGGRGALTLFWLYGGYVTWKNHTTTEYTSTATQVSSAECPVQFATDWDVEGTVTESTNKDIVIGQKVAMVLCAGAPNDEPIYASQSGTKIKF